jgi:hypothetical protein
VTSFEVTDFRSRSQPNFDDLRLTMLRHRYCPRTARCFR